MRLRPVEPKICLDDPFDDDLFDRKKFADSLIRMIHLSDDRGLVISLDGKWGVGKSLFVRQFAQYLDNQVFEYPPSGSSKHLIEEIDKRKNQQGIYHSPLCTVVLDAFESEHLGMPEHVLLHTLQKHASKVLGILTQEQTVTGFLNNFGAALEERIGFDSDKILTKKTRHAELAMERRSKNLSEIRKQLHEICECVYKETGLPVVFVVDELDRCDPMYAVELIELIKHIFDKSRTVFVLVIQKEQLNESLKMIYGPGVDSERYWQKFVHIDVVLPSGEPLTLQHYIKFAQNRARAFELPGILRERLGAECCRGQVEFLESLLCQYIGKFSHILDLSARQLQRIFASLVVLLSNDKVLINNVLIAAFLLTIKVGRRELFEEMSSEKVPAFLALKKIGLEIEDIDVSVASPEYNVLVFLLAASFDRQLEAYQMFAANRQTLPVILRHIRLLEDRVNKETQHTAEQVFFNYCNQVRTLA